jgi:thymidylate synthase (FAD)
MKKGHLINVLDKGYVRLVDWMGSDSRIVEAARVSYGEPSKGEEADKKLLFRLYRDKHTSPFEMAKVVLDFKMPIFVMRQYIRHRMQNLNEFSMRYKEAPDEFYVPAQWRKQEGAKNKQGSVVEEGWTPILKDPDYFRLPCYLRSRVRSNSPLLGLYDDPQLPSDALKEMNSANFSLYKAMLDAGIAREMARIVLPLNIYTYFYATWDLKNLLHFITLREDSHAQAEIQEYGRVVKGILTELFPWTMEAYERYKFPCVDTQTEMVVQKADYEALKAEITRLKASSNDVAFGTFPGDENADH